MKRLVIPILTLSLAACGGNASTLLGGGSTKKPSAADLVSAPVADPKTRAVQVAWNVSRANKCGFNLDAATLKQSYIAYELAQGAQAESLPALEKSYEFARIEITDRINKTEGDYCTEKRVNETRADLGRYLAGDFAARKIEKTKDVPTGGLFDAFDTGVKPPEKTTDEALAPKE